MVLGLKYGKYIKDIDFRLIRKLLDMCLRCLNMCQNAQLVTYLNYNLWKKIFEFLNRQSDDRLFGYGIILIGLVALIMQGLVSIFQAIFQS